MDMAKMKEMQKKAMKMKGAKKFETKEHGGGKVPPMDKC